MGSCPAPWLGRPPPAMLASVPPRDPAESFPSGLALCCSSQSGALPRAARLRHPHS